MFAFVRVPSAIALLKAKLMGEDFGLNRVRLLFVGMPVDFKVLGVTEFVQQRQQLSSRTALVTYSNDRQPLPIWTDEVGRIGEYLLPRQHAVVFACCDELNRPRTFRQTKLPPINAVEPQPTGTR
jgi:hypothetical protein